MISQTQQKLIDLGLPKQHIGDFKAYKTIKPKIDITKENLGTLSVIRPLGVLKGKIVYLLKCECGNRCLKTIDDIRKTKLPNCGCKDKSGEGYEYWKKIRSKLNRVWRDSYPNFRDECWLLKADNKFLNRRYTDKKIGPTNFFWSERDEKAHIIHDKVVDILVISQGLTRQGAIEKAVLMSRRRKLKLIAAHKQKQAKDYDLRFLEKYGRKQEIEAVKAKHIKLPTKALYMLSQLLETAKYDELNLDFYFTKDTLKCQLARLAQPITWNQESETWDL